MVEHAITNTSRRDVKDGIGHLHKYGNVSAKWKDSLNINSVQFGTELPLILE
jgi:hypothetical protein